jgi:hypothetical protein
MTILDHRFTMNPTVDAWKLILDLYNQINNVVNEQRLISKEHALDLDVSIPDGMISHITEPIYRRFWSCRDTLRKHGVWTSRFGRHQVGKVLRRKVEHDIPASPTS